MDAADDIGGKLNNTCSPALFLFKSFACGQGVLFYSARVFGRMIDELMYFINHAQLFGISLTYYLAC